MHIWSNVSSIRHDHVFRSSYWPCFHCLHRPSTSSNARRAHINWIQSCCHRFAWMTFNAHDSTWIGFVDRCCEARRRLDDELIIDIITIFTTVLCTKFAQRRPALSGNQCGCRNRQNWQSEYQTDDSNRYWNLYADEIAISTLCRWSLYIGGQVPSAKHEVTLSRRKWRKIASQLNGELCAFGDGGVTNSK